MYVRFVKKHVDILRLLASEDPFPDFKTVASLIDESQETTQRGAKARETLALHCNMILSSTPFTDLRIFSDVFHILNTNASTHLKNVGNDIGHMTPLYVEAIGRYADESIQSLRHVWIHGDPKSWNNITRSQDKITARMAVWFTIPDDAIDVPLPLICEWLLDDTWNTLDSLKDAFSEVNHSSN